jgi:hypothetical protein|tara:strand:+ start:261 stop:542 length:282 start_codon:yes stop_codon:yes gene_type:complete
MIEKEYKQDEPQYFCWWEDSCGVYTRQELKEQYSETNLYDTLRGDEWVGYSRVYEIYPSFKSFDEVLDYLEEDEDLIQDTKFICHNMSIIRVL